MSLLMKALASAEKEKQEKVQLQQAIDAKHLPIELSLQPREEEIKPSTVDALAPEANVALRSIETNKEKPLLLDRQKAWQKKHSSQTLTKNNHNQHAAANMFTAAQLPKSYFKHALFALGFVAIGLMIWLGSALLPYQQTLQPEMQNENIATQADFAPTIQSTGIKNDSSFVFNPEKSSAAPYLVAENKDIAPKKNHSLTIVKTDKNSADSPDLQKKTSDAQAPDTLISEKTTSLPKTPNQPETSRALSLISQKQSPSVDPILLSAYQSFNQGQLTHAQQQYRQVLQKDVRNIDALLGMAAIAEKQERMADAAGWYLKVLEIEPNHTLASTAIFNMQTKTDATSQISRLKNLIAQQPESANLHATLGNVYAQQNDWLSAQEAYFEATRFAPVNPDFAFNVAVSLEHLGKPALALLQYQRALMLVQQSGSMSPDQQVLKARISALQPSS